MDSAFKALKGIGTIAIASFTFVSLPVINSPVEAAETEPSLNKELYRSELRHYD